MLAAGASRRASGIKALAKPRGQIGAPDAREGLAPRSPAATEPLRVEAPTLLEGIVSKLRLVGCAPILLVLGPPHGDRLRGRVADESVIWNAHPERGMLSSLQLGAAAALRAEASHLMVALVDHPHVRIETLRALLEACKGSGSSLVRPRYRGRRGHPWIADAALLRRILALSLDVPEGVRTAFRGLDSELELELDDPAILEDLDTLEELRRAGFEPEVPGGGFP